MTVRELKIDRRRPSRTAGAGRRLLARRHWKQIRHDFTPKLFIRSIWGDGGAASFRNPSLADRTPRPWTFMYEAGLLACGSRHPFAFPRHLRLSGSVERMLAAYSCGGSSGLSRPSWPPRIPVLAFNPFESKEPRTQDIVDEVKNASMAMKTYQRLWGERREQDGSVIHSDQDEIADGGACPRRRMAVGEEPAGHCRD